MVKERFAASNAYFALDRLISGAVKQLQRAVGKIDAIFGGIPSVSAIVNFVQIFIGIALGYVDECCLGYTFYKKDEGAFKCGCDGVVIYYQNATHLLKNAAVTSLIVMGALVIKAAFIDSYMLVKTMVSYMEVAPQTKITYNLYEKPCKLSG